VYSKPHYVTTSDLEQEAKTDIIKLDDHDPDIVDHMINFMYSGDYTISYPDLNEIEESEACLDEDAESETTGLDVGELDASQELLVHTAVYRIAEEKDILALKQLAKKKYEAALPNGWNSMAFCDSLRIIYDETPENDRCYGMWLSASLGRRPRSSWIGENSLSCGRKRERLDWQFFVRTCCQTDVKTIHRLPPP
jgi:hypothetical protein